MIDFDKVLGPCMQVFGESVVYTAPGHLPQSITGIFDRAYLELLPMGGNLGQEPMQFGAAGNITDRRPILGVQLSQFPHPPQRGDAVRLPQRGNLLFEVKEVQEDGHGGAKLILMRAN